MNLTAATKEHRTLHLLRFPYDDAAQFAASLVSSALVNKTAKEHALNYNTWSTLAAKLSLTTESIEHLIEHARGCSSVLEALLDLCQAIGATSLQDEIVEAYHAKLAEVSL